MIDGVPRAHGIAGAHVFTRPTELPQPAEPPQPKASPERVQTPGLKGWFEITTAHGVEEVQIDAGAHTAVGAVGVAETDMVHLGSMRGHRR